MKEVGWLGGRRKKLCGSGGWAVGGGNARQILGASKTIRLPAQNLRHCYFLAARLFCSPQLSTNRLKPSPQDDPGLKSDHQVRILQISNRYTVAMIQT